MNHEIVIMLGIQGSGKGTIAAELRRVHDYNYIETGDIFRHLDRTTAIGAEVGAVIDAGNMVRDELTCALMATKMTDDCDMLTDGFPRDVAQAEFVMNWARDNNFCVRAVMLNIPDEMVAMRIAKRIAAGGGRADDADPAAVAKRIATYHEKTEPMINFLRTADGVEFLDIDGIPDIATVTASVRAALGI